MTTRPITLALMLSVLTGLAGFTSSCKTESDIKGPVAVRDTIPIEIPVSTFNIPVTYAVKDLEIFINKIIQGEFLSMMVYPTQSVKDEIKVELFREKNIRLSSNGQELVCRFPVKVVATILNSRLNFLTKDIDPVESELELELRTPVALDARWHLVTHFRLIKTTWVKAPVVTIAGINIDLTNKVDAYLKENEEKFIGLMNKGVNKSVSIDKPIARIWRNLQKPIVIHKNPPQAYVMFACESITSDFVLENDNIVCNTSIKAKVVMLADSSDHSEASQLPPFVFKKGGDAYSDTYVYAFVDFADINEQLNLHLKGKTFETGGFVAKVDSLYVYASDKGLTVDLNTSGALACKLVASGHPKFNPETQSVSLEDFQFNVTSENVLLETGAAYLNDMIRDTIQSQLNIGMDSLIKMVPGIIELAIANGKPGKSIDLCMDELKVVSCDITLGAKRVHIMAHTTFLADIRLKKLKVKKQLYVTPRPPLPGK